MDTLVIIILLSFGSILGGYLFNLLCVKTKLLNPAQIASFSRKAKEFTVNVLIPVTILSAFWKISLADGRLLWLPLLGILMLLVGGSAALLFNRRFQIPPSRAAAVFTCGMLTNMAVYPGFIGFMVFGEKGFMMTQLMSLLELFTYYLVSFPLSNMINKGTIKSFRLDSSFIKDRPANFIPLAAIISGLLLHHFQVGYPHVLDYAMKIIIPSTTGIMGLSIGVTIKFRKIGSYKKEVALVSAIKFLIVPVVVITAAYLLGMNTVMDGIAFKMVILHTLMPVAFLASVPPVLYGFDLDLTNSAWIVTNILALCVAIPVFYLIVA